MQHLLDLNTRDELWRAGVKLLAFLYPNSCQYLAQEIYCYAENIEKIKLVTEKDFSVSNEVKNKFIQSLERLLSHEPLSKILGKNEFYGEEFFVSHDTLDPREDSHILIDAILEKCEKNQSHSILDIGAGTGCLSIILAKFFSDSDVIGLDFSEQAIIIANKNAHALGVSSNCSFIQKDILSVDTTDFISNDEQLEIQKQSFDIILSNPPYIPTGAIDYLDDMVSKYDPKLALDGGDDGLVFYRHIAMLVPYLARVNSKIFFEFGIGQGAYIKEILSQYGCEDFKFYRDDGYIIRVISCTYKNVIV